MTPQDNVSQASCLKESPGACDSFNVQFPGPFPGDSVSVRLRRGRGTWKFHKCPAGTYDQAHLFIPDLYSKNQLKLSCLSLECRLEII